MFAVSVKRDRVRWNVIRTLDPHIAFVEAKPMGIHPKCEEWLYLVRSTGGVSAGLHVNQQKHLHVGFITIGGHLCFSGFCLGIIFEEVELLTLKSVLHKIDLLLTNTVSSLVLCTLNI